MRGSLVHFACCDMPDANTLTVGLFAVIAQHERETISQRTKDALQAKSWVLSRTLRSKCDRSG
jgi:hypothetical protein